MASTSAASAPMTSCVNSLSSYDSAMHAYPATWHPVHVWLRVSPSLAVVDPCRVPRNAAASSGVVNRPR